MIKKVNAKSNRNIQLRPQVKNMIRKKLFAMKKGIKTLTPIIHQDYLIIAKMITQKLPPSGLRVQEGINGLHSIGSGMKAPKIRSTRRWSKI